MSLRADQLQGLLLVAQREWRMGRRTRAAGGTLALLLAIALLPAVLSPLRSGTLGLASFSDVVLLALAVGGVTLPLLGLLAGADALSTEIEDGTLLSVVTLPISRRACFFGKLLGRASLGAILYALAFGSVFLAIAVAQRSSGGAESVRASAGAGSLDRWAGSGEYLAVVMAGLLLFLCSLGIGLALGAGAASRLQAFGAALVTWLVLVFAIDALLLAIVVASAPPAPAPVGHHGHGELAPPDAQKAGPTEMPTPPMPIHDPMADEVGGDEPAAPGTGLVWWLTLAPVDTYRLTVLTAGARAQGSLASVLPGVGARAPWLPLVVGWLFWLTVPPFVALWRFERVALR